jgi:hypothetical protein
MKQLWNAPRFDDWVSECLEQAEEITPFQRGFPISLIKFKMIDWVPKWVSYIEKIDNILWNEFYLVVGEKKYRAMEFDSRKLTHPTPFFVIGAIEEVTITLHSQLVHKPSEIEGLLASISDLVQACMQFKYFIGHIRNYVPSTEHYTQKKI